MRQNTRQRVSPKPNQSVPSFRGELTDVEGWRRENPPVSASPEVAAMAIHEILEDLCAEQNHNTDDESNARDIKAIEARGKNEEDSTKGTGL